MSLVEWSGVLSNFAQVVGAIAVVATLVYLSAQVKQNTEAIQCANATTVQINFQNLARDLSTDRELSDVIVRAIKGEEDLAQAEKLAAYAWFFGMLKAGELAHTLFLRGGLESDYWHGSLAFYRAYWTTPGFRKYWVDRRQAFTPVFRAAVDAWMADSSETVTRTDKLFD
jgi:hypothetical protein